jgi:hypothetical protein
MDSLPDVLRGRLSVPVPFQDDFMAVRFGIGYPAPVIARQQSHEQRFPHEPEHAPKRKAPGQIGRLYINSFRNKIPFAIAVYSTPVYLYPCSSSAISH